MTNVVIEYDDQRGRRSSKSDRDAHEDLPRLVVYMLSIDANADPAIDLIFRTGTDDEAGSPSKITAAFDPDSIRDAVGVAAISRQTIGHQPGREHVTGSYAEFCAEAWRQ